VLLGAPWGRVVSEAPHRGDNDKMRRSIASRTKDADVFCLCDCWVQISGQERGASTLRWGRGGRGEGRRRSAHNSKQNKSAAATIQLKQKQNKTKSFRYQTSFTPSSSTNCAQWQ